MTQDCNHQRSQKVMMLLCKECEHWNQIEKVRRLESRLEKSLACLGRIENRCRSYKSMDTLSILDDAERTLKEIEGA